MTFGLPPNAYRQINGLWRNPLAFPAGRKPGFDPLHPASQGMQYGGSFIGAAGGFFVPLNTAAEAAGIAGTVNQLPIGTAIGVATGGGQATSYFTMPSITPTAVTAAAIFMTTVASSATGYHTLIGSNAIGFYINNTTAPYRIDLFTGSADTLTSALVSVNVPYFVSCSYTNGVGMVGCLLNLNTGQLFTFNVSSAGNLSATATFLAVGNDYKGSGGSSGGIGAAGGVSHAMFSTANLALRQHIAWAADPYSFWYPDPYQFDYVGASVSVSRFRTLIGVGQ
jgi:hypothetical protein